MKAQGERFDQAAHLIESGDVAALRALTEEDPALVAERLTEPSEWMKSRIGRDLESFFRDPFLLWFTTEDAQLFGELPPNVGESAQVLIDGIRQISPETLQEQVDYALRLAAWSPVAARCGVQNALIDVFLGAGAQAKGVSNDALVNGHFEAARHLLESGAPASYASALCLGRWEDADRLAGATDRRGKQFALVLCALRGQAEGASRALREGADPNAPSQDLYSHGTPLHHAVYSASLETVRVLLEAGADRNTVDTLWESTSLGWAQYCGEEARDPAKREAYAKIAEFLEGLG